MNAPSPALDQALATLATRWGSAAIRLGSGRSVPAITPVPVEGALAPALLPEVEAPSPGQRPGPSPDQPPVDGSVVPTGFAALDAALGLGGLPRAATATVRGDASSGRTTLALRLAAEAQARGAIVTWLDAGMLDPVEAVARGVDLARLAVLEPRDLDEGLAMAGALLQGRAVDLLVADLPERGTAPRHAVAVRRLAALARRAGALLVVLEPPALPGTLRSALAEASGLRLELRRRAWIRLGRDVVGQRTEVLVAKDRHGLPGRRAEIEILYADGTGRDGCLARPELLADRPAATPARAGPPGAGRTPSTGTFQIAPSSERIRHAPPPPRLVPSAAPAGAARFALLPGGPGRPGRPALGAGDGPRREPRGARLRGAAGDAARRGA